MPCWVRTPPPCTGACDVAHVTVGATGLIGVAVMVLTLCLSVPLGMMAKKMFFDLDRDNSGSIGTILF